MTSSVSKACPALVPNVSGDPRAGLECPARNLDLRIRRLLSPGGFTYIVSVDEAIARSHRTTDKATQTYPPGRSSLPMSPRANPAWDELTPDSDPGA